MKISAKWLAQKYACSEGLQWFQDQKETESLSVLQSLISQKKYDWANWLIVRTMNRKQYCQYAIFAAEQVLDIYEKKYPDDKRPRQAIKAAKLACEKPTKKNKVNARAAARAAACAAEAEAAAWAAAWAAAAARAWAWAAAAAWAWVAAKEEMQKQILEYGMSLLKK
jgi:hypothetical protein